MNENDFIRLFPYAAALTMDDIRERCRGIHSLTENRCGEEPLSELEDNELRELTDIAEEISLGARQALASKNVVRFEDCCTVPSDAKVKIPVAVRFKDNVLTVTVPPTFARSNPDSWALPGYVKLALNQFVKENGKPDIPHPAYVIVKRKVTAYKSGYRDNENFESSRIINAVMEVLGYTDRADHLGYVSVLDHVESIRNSCVDFYFLSARHLANHPELISFRPQYCSSIGVDNKHQT